MTNMVKYITYNNNERQSAFYRLRFPIALIVSIVLLIFSCKKESTTNNQAFFEANVVNQNLTIHMAEDNGTDVTNQFSSYTFKFTKTTANSGTLTATNTLLNFNGTWSVSTDFYNLTISLPSPPIEFSFLNRVWKFTQSSIPIMELSSSASGDNKLLHFQKQ